MNIHNCKDELNDANLRATPARVALMRLLESSNTPLDVGTMIDYLEKHNIKTDPATVFRIVNVFRKKGLAKQLQLQEGKFRYELSSRPDHHHLICEKCGTIEDISDCNIDLLEKDIKRKEEFLVKSHYLEFFGVCHACSA